MAREISLFQSSPHHSLVRVAGELDLMTAPLLRDVLTSADDDPTRELVIELSAVTFMDCSGLAPLLEARAKLGERLRLTGLPGAVTRLLHLVGLDTAFPIDDSTAGAVQDATTSAHDESRASRGDWHGRTRADETPGRRDGLIPAVRPCAGPEPLRAETTGAAAVPGTPVLIAQAIGLLTASLGCDERRAARALRQIAWDRDSSLEDAAAALARAVETRRTPPRVPGPAANAIAYSQTTQRSGRLTPRNEQPLR